VRCIAGWTGTVTTNADASADHVALQPSDAA
jgi:hypothetical protein